MTEQNLIGMIEMSEAILVAVEGGQHRAAISVNLRQEGYYPILEAENGQRTLDLLRHQPDIACVLAQSDLIDMKGEDFVSRIHAINAHVPIIILVKTESDPHLPQMLDAGVDDFLALPPSPLRLKVTLNTLFRHRRMKSEAAGVRRYAEDHLNLRDWVAKSTKMRALVAQVRKAIRQRGNIIIFGEKGCEHELAARIIHRENKARKGSFVRIQCLDSSKGETYQHSWQTHIVTKLAQVQQGSLCLADIDRLDEVAQHHLVELIEQAQMGTNQDVRFIATTTVEPSRLIEEQKFNPQLLSLIEGTRLEIPPLRERQADIEELCHEILKVIILETGRRQINAMGKRALALCQDYDWPGNVTELENSLFRAVLLSDGPVLSVQDFPQIWRKVRFEVMGHDRMQENLLSIQGKEAFWDEFGHIRPLAEIEKFALDAAIQRYGGRLSEVARRLGLGRSTLYRKIKLTASERGNLKIS